MISIFTDLTERSPTFGLNPIDVIGVFPKRSWITMFTNAYSNEKAWLKFLGRPFKGLKHEVFEKPFENIIDLDLRKRALNSLKNAGPDQANLYDFSFSDENIKDHPIEEGDLCMLALLPHELEQLKIKESCFTQYIRLVVTNKAQVVVLLFTYSSLLSESDKIITCLRAIAPDALIL